MTKPCVFEDLSLFGKFDVHYIEKRLLYPLIKAGSREMLAK